jgi:hypothetical protein
VFTTAAEEQKLRKFFSHTYREFLLLTFVWNATGSRLVARNELDWMTLSPLVLTSKRPLGGRVYDTPQVQYSKLVSSLLLLIPACFCADI